MDPTLQVRATIFDDSRGGGMQMMVFVTVILCVWVYECMYVYMMYVCMGV